jgi:hypothetical protein
MCTFVLLELNQGIPVVGSEVKYLETNFDENISFRDGNVDIEREI